jgi:hypothetical protein
MYLRYGVGEGWVLAKVEFVVTGYEEAEGEGAEATDEGACVIAFVEGISESGKQGEVCETAGIFA